MALGRYAQIASGTLRSSPVDPAAMRLRPRTGGDAPELIRRLIGAPDRPARAVARAVASDELGGTVGRGLTSKDASGAIAVATASPALSARGRPGPRVRQCARREPLPLG